MMSVDDKTKALVLANGISAAAANLAMVRLVKTLAQKDILTKVEVEAFRHLHLTDFDGIIDDTSHHGAREALHDIREVVDKKWQSAIRDLENRS